MDKFKEILTKYWVGILCGVIALIAMIASVVPLGGYHDELKAKLQGSAQTFQSLSGLQTSPRLKPKMFEDAEQKPLEKFPSQSIIESGKVLVDSLESESTKAMEEVVKTNRRQPLVAGVLPNPMGNGPFMYREAYIRRLNPTDGTLVHEVLKTGVPPTKEQITAEEKQRWATKYEPMIFKDANGQPMADSLAEVQRVYQLDMAKLPGEMRGAVAAATKVYMAPNAITMEPVVAAKQGLPPTPQQIWWSQLALWVQEDVAAAIAEANKNAPDVTHSRVKRLISLNVPIGPQMLFGRTLNAASAGGMGGMGMGGMGGMGEPGMGAGPSQNPNDPVVLDHKLTPTGRTSNGLFDVVQFQVEMIVSAKELPVVLTSFSNNRLMTVLNVSQLIAEDGKAAAADGFLYGPDPVVRVVLKCEALFLREWTVPLMPQQVKNMLGIQPPAPTAAIE